MPFPLKLAVPNTLFPGRRGLSPGTIRNSGLGRVRKMTCSLLALAWPLAAAFAQSSSPSPQSQTQQSSTQTQPQSQAQPAASGQPPQKEDAIAEAARKARDKKAAAAKAKVYTEDDLSGMKGSGISVVGNAPKTEERRAKPKDPEGDFDPNSEEYWRGKARKILDAIARTERQIALKKEEIKKFGSGGVDITTGMKDNVAYIEDRNGQLKELEKHKAALQKQLDDLADEGRKAGAPPAWFR